MWDTIIGEAIVQGIWCALCVALMIYILRDGKKREQGYCDMIGQLHESLAVVGDIQNAIREISESLREMNRDMCAIKQKVNIQSKMQETKK